MVEDRFFDRFGKRFFPYFYFTGRVDVLLIFIVASVGWVAFGFDGTIEQIVLSPYGVGIHWSTVQTCALSLYLLILNMHVGGIKSLGQLRSEVWRDLRTNWVELRNVHRVRLGRRWARRGRLRFPLVWLKVPPEVEELKERYSGYPAVDPMRGFVFALAVTLVSLFAFEVIWVPLYDWFQFGSWYWPVYSALDGSGNPFLSAMFVRNVGTVAAMSIVAVMTLYLAWDGQGSNIWRRYSIAWRFDRWFALIAFATVSLWLVWIFYPHQPFTVTVGDVLSQGPFNSSYFASQTWLFPSQGLFPQNEYTFYHASLFMKTYGTSAIYGFHVQDDVLHLINVLAKYFTFLLVGYPSLVMAKRNETPEEAAAPDRGHQEQADNRPGRLHPRFARLSRIHRRDVRRPVFASETYSHSAQGHLGRIEGLGQLPERDDDPWLPPRHAERPDPQ
jgi:hypothetical protein